MELVKDKSDRTDVLSSEDELSDSDSSDSVDDNSPPDAEALAKELLGYEQELEKYACMNRMREYENKNRIGAGKLLKLGPNIPEIDEAEHEVCFFSKFDFRSMIPKADRLYKENERTNLANFVKNR